MATATPQTHINRSNAATGAVDPTLAIKDSAIVHTTSTTSSMSSSHGSSDADTLVHETSSLSLDDSSRTTTTDKQPKLSRSITKTRDFASQNPSGPPTIRLRKPAVADPTFHGPSPEWLSGKWHITHSTLPTWKDKRNVTITYTLVAQEKLEDKVEFDPVYGGAVRSVSGRQVATPKSGSNRKGTPTASPRGSLDGGDRAAAAERSQERPGRLVRMNTVEAHEQGVSANADQGEVVDWDWHGKGLIKLASAHWEILGWGGHEGSEWVVTYFKKTYLTPEGVNLYVRDPAFATDEFVGRVKEGLGRLEHPGVQKLVEQIYEVQRT